MGLVNFSVPEIEVEYLRSNLNLDVFVEGGTYKGDTAKNMIDINMGPSQSSSLNDFPALGVFKIKIGPQGAKKINIL